MKTLRQVASFCGLSGPSVSIRKLADKVSNYEQPISLRKLLDKGSKRTWSAVLLKVTVILTSKKDGSQPLYEIVNGKVIPKTPYLRSLTRHPTLDDNFIKDWINLANRQLESAGCNFGLDNQDIRYVFENNDAMNTLDGGKEADNDAIRKEIQKRVDDPTNKDFYHRVVLLYRWGGGKYPDSPAGQSYTALDSPLIILNPYRQSPIISDGENYGLGDSQLTHEFGHFMSLNHTFASFAGSLAEMAELKDKTGIKRNPLYLPLLKSNLNKMNGVTEAELLATKMKAEQLLGQKYLNEFDGDSYDVTDTPIDLWLGFPLIWGYNACSTDKFVQVDAKDGKAWIPINRDVRNNIMSYWTCFPLDQFFSPQQVMRMEKHLENNRSQLKSNGRTIAILEIA
ncbi:MAG: hypothetical protein WCJ93_11110 [Methanomicrobiales archaeon]